MHMLPTLLLSAKLCFPASLAGSLWALESMNIPDKAFRLQKSSSGTSGTKILCESKFGGLGGRGIDHQCGSHL